MEIDECLNIYVNNDTMNSLDLVMVSNLELQEVTI